MNRLAQLDWEKGGDGLLPAVVQHAQTGTVLMLAYMNAQALARPRETGRVTFYSRSKQRLWTKGETSGNYLRLVDLKADCDGDTLLVSALPAGPVCHLGTATCFDAEADGTAPPADGTKAPGGPPRADDVLGDLEAVIAGRAAALAADPDAAAESYVARLLARGPAKTAQKVGEEGVEVALAVAAEDDAAVISEAADLVFHLLVALRARGLPFADVLRELDRRRR
jgi:phosphoribosyl-ATP pyrophosphohydrolase/phosphoribosyl-AMP cyclohydrolase